MERENEIVQELNMLQSSLATMPRIMPFTVPNRYFETLDLQILAGLLAAENGVADIFITDELPFSVPDDYFENFPAQVIASTGLPAPQKEAIDVPQGYFDALPDRILELIRNDEKAPVKRTKTISFAPKWRALQWAAAAMLVLGLGLGSLSMYNNTPDHKATHQLAGVDKEAINQYMVQGIDDETETSAIAMNSPAAASVKNLSTEEIANYLDENSWEDAASAN